MARVRKEESGKSKGCHDWDSDLSIWQKVKLSVKNMIKFVENISLSSLCLVA